MFGAKKDGMFFLPFIILGVFGTTICESTRAEATYMGCKIGNRIFF